MVRAAILFHIKRRVFHVWELNAWSTEHIKWKISIGNLPEQEYTSGLYQTSLFYHAINFLQKDLETTRDKGYEQIKSK